MLAAGNMTERETQEWEFLPSGCLYSSGLMCDTLAHIEKRYEGKGLSGGTGKRRS